MSITRKRQLIAVYIQRDMLATPEERLEAVRLLQLQEGTDAKFPQSQECVLLVRRYLRSRFIPVLIVLLSLSLLLAVGCSASDGESPEGTGAEYAIVWEAWDVLSENYAAPDSLDHEAVAGGAIKRVLDMGEIPPYPFLTDLGRMRGQVPLEVPEELTDVWRASQIYREDNPDLDADELEGILIQGMMAGLLGTGAAYLTPEQLTEARKQVDRNLQGSYLGIGASVVAQEGKILLFPFSDSPAEKAGIVGGDSLIAVDGVPVGDATPSEVGERVKGPENTKVLLKLERPGEAEPLELDVFRGHIELDSVASQLVQGGIGYVRVTRFRDNTGAQVFEALERLKQFDMLALILDLRRNSGGVPAAAAEVAAQFLPGGSTFRYVEDREGTRSDHTIPDEVDLLSLDELPVAVMVDGRSHSEAEALAAALQQAGRAQVVGVPTFGEGASYDFVELSDGSALYLPTSHWFTPDGTWVGDEPIQPDVYVEYEEVPSGVGGERQFNAAYDLLNEQLPLFR